jgi:hypothetical protein
VPAERKKTPGLFAQASNKGTVVNKNNNHCGDNINSDYRTISVPNLGKRNLSGYLATTNSDDVRNKTSTAVLYRRSYYVCPVLGAEIDYFICHVCLSICPSVRSAARPHETSRLNLNGFL